MDLLTWIFVDKFLPTFSSASLLLVAGSLIRWGIKVDKGLTAQTSATKEIVALQEVANQRMVAALGILVEKLNGHVALDDERHSSQKDILDSHEQRLQSVERAAFRGR